MPPREMMTIMDIGRYKIGTVAQMIGITPNLLRAWERRHQVLLPVRQGGNQRLYSAQDVEVLRAVVMLTRKGISIGEAASLGRKRLLELVQESPPIVQQAGWSPVGEPEREQSLWTGPTSEVLQQIPLLNDKVRDQVQRLAPLDLIARRTDRYAGESLEIHLSEIPSTCRSQVERIYFLTSGLYELWTYMEQQVTEEFVYRRVRHLAEASLKAAMDQIESMVTLERDPLVRGALEDICGGAMLPLQREAQRQVQYGFDASSLLLVVSLARDQAKMMRNAIVDLDSTLREADEHSRSHDMGPITHKLLPLRSIGWVQEVASDYSGPICCRCLEVSALDRVLYRFLGAGRHGTVDIYISSLAQNKGLLRVACHYSTGAPENLATLSGFDTRIVAQAAGVGFQAAIDAGYLGRKENWAWFHWPTYVPPIDVPRCQCHPIRAS